MKLLLRSALVPQPGREVPASFAIKHPLLHSLEITSPGLWGEGRGKERGTPQQAHLGLRLPPGWFPSNPLWKFQFCLLSLEERGEVSDDGPLAIHSEYNDESHAITNKQESIPDD